MVPLQIHIVGSNINSQYEYILTIDLQEAGHLKFELKPGANIIWKDFVYA
jgi:hypothetical protein